MSLTKDEIFNHVKQVLTDLFELEPGQLVAEARLYEDLDIDSIDTIDLLIELKRIVNKDIDAQAFKNARTIDDVVNTIAELSK
ncbi:MAG: acyl carrier protein [Gammaproteobacteria bacterium]|nr:acyl carrier protein [Gammaproteobacteria bacterium]